MPPSWFCVLCWAALLMPFHDGVGVSSTYMMPDESDEHVQV